MRKNTKTSVVDKIENAWNGAWYGVKRDANKLKGLSFYKSRSKTGIFVPKDVKTVQSCIKEATNQVYKAECMARDAVKTAQQATKALNSTLAAVQKLKTKGTVTTISSKKRKTKTGTKAKQSSTRRRYRAA